METEISGLYAVGDLRATPFRQLIVAVGEGAEAFAMSMKSACFWLFPPGKCLYIREEFILKFKMGDSAKSSSSSYPLCYPAYR